MPGYTGEDAWLFAGDYFDGCGSCGQSDCDGCNYVRPKPLPRTTVTVLRTGGPVVLLFDNGWHGKRFIFGADHRNDRPELSRYDEVWQRITPYMKNGEPGLKIRFLDNNMQPLKSETTLSTPTSNFTFTAKSHKYFALSVRNGFGASYQLYGGNGNDCWWFDLIHGKCVPITDLRVEGNLIRYTTKSGEYYSEPDSIFDYGSGQRIVHNPSFSSVMAGGR